MNQGKALIFSDPEDFIKFMEELQEAYLEHHEEGVERNE